MSASERLRERLSTQRDDLVGQLQVVLRETLFISRAYVRPADLRRIAEAEVDAYFDFLRQPDDTAATARGAHLCQVGLGEQTILRMGQALRLFCHTHMDADLFLVGMEAADTYHNGLVRGFIQEQKTLILEEQERIRSALQRAISRHTRQMEAAAAVTHATTSILELKELLTTSVNLIRERFGFNTDIFLVDERRRWAVLRASAGESGQGILRRGHKLKVGGDSLVGWCTAHGQARFALDQVREAVRFETALPPEAGSKMALPLISRGQVIGAMTVQSDRVAALDDQDVTMLQTMAGQLANAIENARLYEQIQQDAAELERRVAERTAELAAINSELEAFAYSVSHDLRAPLRGIDGFSQALLEDYADKLDAVGQDYLRRVQAASQHMGQLIDDLLKLSRVTRAEAYHEPVELSALAQMVATDLQQQEPERQVEFVIAEGLIAKGDARLLRVVLENLLGNAWKFTAKNPRARIEFGSARNNGNLAYFVRDDGVGFNMAYANKLFGAFQRLHSATEFEGTGIGLASVQRIIHRHGGRVWAEGEVEKGATFYFTLAAKG
jgi:signal transduction histidine kinase